MDLLQTRPKNWIGLESGEVCVGKWKRARKVKKVPWSRVDFKNGSFIADRSRAMDQVSHLLFKLTILVLSLYS